MNLRTAHADTKRVLTDLDPSQVSMCDQLEQVATSSPGKQMQGLMQALRSPVNMGLARKVLAHLKDPDDPK